MAIVWRDEEVGGRSSGVGDGYVEGWGREVWATYVRGRESEGQRQEECFQHDENRRLV